MSLSCTHRLGRRLGDLLWLALKDRRELATSEISFHLNIPQDQAKRMAHASFRHSGCSFLEIFQSHRFDVAFLEKHVEIADQASFQAMMENTRPCVGASAHMGAWELLAGAFEHLIPQHPKQIVVRRSKDVALHEVITNLRSKPHVDILPHRNAVRSVLKCLKKGGMSGFLVDHNCSTSEAVFLPFLNRVAAVNMGPALLAVRAQAIIQPIFLVRKPEGEGYILHTERALDTCELTGSTDQKIHKAALFYTQAVERVVRKYPEQWYWLHKRWKTRPPEGWEYAHPDN